eukprot:2146437-Pyramimonas_sp.AAC.1
MCIRDRCRQLRAPDGADLDEDAAPDGDSREGWSEPQEEGRVRLAWSGHEHRVGKATPEGADQGPHQVRRELVWGA